MSNENEIDSMDVDSNQIEPTEPTESANKTLNNNNNNNNNNENKDNNNNKNETDASNNSNSTKVENGKPFKMDSKRKATLQERLRKLVKETRNIIVSGCGNWRCTNPYCQSNIENINRKITEAEASKLALKIIKLKSKKCLQYPNLAITPITYDNVSKLIEEKKENDNNKNNIIIETFKHWDIFYDSFKTSKKVSENNVEINFTELDKTIEIIMTQDELCKDISNILLDVMDKYLCNISSGTYKLNLNSLRSLIILVFCPLILSEDLTCHILLNKLLLIFEKINEIDFKSIKIIHKWFSNITHSKLQLILHSLHQYMTLKIIQKELDIEDLTEEEWKIELKYDDTEDNDERDEISQEIEKKQQIEREKYILTEIAPTIKFIDIIFIANKLIINEDDDEEEENKMDVDEGDKKDNNNIDIIHTILNNKLDLELFHNDGLNDAICSKTQSRSHIHRRDFIHYKEHDFFTFLSYPYLLNAASKSRYLEFENLLRQHRARRRRMFDLMLSGGVNVLGGINRNQLIEELDLVLRIRRDSIITDTLGILQLQEAQHLRKRLRIIFDGEQGIDQGGLTKEYFQLIMKELFDPNYGMFIYNKLTENYWFNRDSFDLSDNNTTMLMNYELVGKLVGIAIYNNTILDLRFPRVIFKKLLETELINFNDFRDYDPEMAKGFEQLLLYKGKDIEDIYCRNFIIKWKNIFGQEKEYDLLDGNGKNIQLNQKNKKKYVDLYTKYILKHSIEQQFSAFLKGFKIVCDSELFNKYASKELELLICGSTSFDFDALESSTKYEDGLNKNSKIVRDFWNIAHQLSDENKRKLLTFCTGSDRVPINGLGEVALTISKNGNDNSKLPTSHTCFNHLLLPEYSNKDILKTRLLTAINNSEGFGLL